MIRVALPKGIVRAKSERLAADLTGASVTGGALRVQGNGVIVHLVKHRDIPGLVCAGLVDVGVTSTDWVFESGRQFGAMRLLDWCDCRISLISAPSAKRPLIRVVTEFPRHAALLRGTHFPEDVSITTISGSTESLVPDVFDACVDCVETGATLRAHNLVELHTVLKTSVVVIANHASAAFAIVCAATASAGGATCAA
jgi:ATP phosphoribosyltransferase